MRANALDTREEEVSAREGAVASTVSGLASEERSAAKSRAELSAAQSALATEREELVRLREQIDAHRAELEREGQRLRARDAQLEGGCARDARASNGEVDGASIAEVARLSSMISEREAANTKLGAEAERLASRLTQV